MESLQFIEFFDDGIGIDIMHHDAEGNRLHFHFVPPPFIKKLPLFPFSWFELGQFVENHEFKIVRAPKKARWPQMAVVKTSTGVKIEKNRWFMVSWVF
jgi:hypothetical protein